MKRIVILLSVLLLVFGLTVSAHAALVDMGDGTIYDTDRELSWLQNANMAGPMTWLAANAWAANLNTLNAGAGFAGFTNWRLPTTTQPDASCSYQHDPDGVGGFPAQGMDVNCVNSEMGHLYYTELGNPAWGTLTNVGPFTNLNADFYWSGTEYALGPDDAWYFLFNYGLQGTNFKDFTFSALAVRSGHRSTGMVTPVGYNPQWLIVTLVSLMGAGGYILRRRIAKQ